MPQAKPTEIVPQGKSNSQGFGPGPNPDPGNEAFGPHSTMITTTEEVDNPLGLGTGSGQGLNKTDGEKEKNTGSDKTYEGGSGKNSR